MAEAARLERRHLAAILAADVVGFAGLIAADEAGTLAGLRALFREVVQPVVAVHGGRIFRLAGDAVLAEFRSAVEALRCAIALQAAVAARETAGPRIALRIGLALGDVVAEGGDLFGDGVNVAARLEALAEPGGILVAAAVAEQARGRVDCGLEDAGPLLLKNIPRPVPAFRILAGPPVPQGDAPDNRATLVVLPLVNLGDPAEDYVADGMTEELTTALSRIRWFFVIARTTAFTYKGRAADVRRIGAELGVRYLLEGSVQRFGRRLRITCQLIEAEAGRHIWAERFDGSLDDIFALQDCVACGVAGAVGPSLQQAEIGRARRKHDARLDAYDLYLRALPHFHRITPADNEVALELLRRAIALDPGFALATALAAFCLMSRITDGQPGPGDEAEAVHLARLAIRLDTEDAETAAWAADVCGYIGRDLITAQELIRKALGLNPNSPTVRMVAGWVDCWLGRPDAAIAHFDVAVCLGPRDPEMPRILSGYALCHLMAERHAEAAEAARRALALRPDWNLARRSLICALALAGKTAEATALAEQLTREAPEAARVDAARMAGVFADQAFVQRRIAVYRALGFPE